ncbi:diguanylate cyclase [Vibrio maerlii]|uniref:diguanylate cyclase n=1 Tax=Vibrio maerlii TaxID=2231648 RepID=UPI000E3DB9D3|nr:diguanylate cyclase [Vibrio maerlii]
MVGHNTPVKILLVDDVQMDRMQLSIRLKQLGHHVEVAANGKEGLEKYAAFDPELVLLDISMPDMDGFDVSRRIRALYPDWVPIIFLSGHDEPEVIAQAIEAGGDDYLVKPVDRLVLNSKLIAMQRIANMRRELKLLTSKLEELNASLMEQANIDGLTSVYNRRYIDKKLEEMISWHGRHTLPLGILLLDVDNFKAFNDNYGHIEGDKCLQAIASTLKSTFTRSGEYVGRYGGEEFIIVISNFNPDDSIAQAERTKEAIFNLNYPHAYSQTAEYVTVSQGGYVFIPQGNETKEEIYSKADSRLYEAKHRGRNGYVFD